MKKYFILIVVIFSFFILLQCDKDEDINYPTNSKIDLKIPSNFPATKFNVAGYEPTVYGVELGKKLFYDGRLAKDNAVACAFCHIQENAFTHHGHSISHGVEGREGFRNTPPIQNLIWLDKFMWDGSVTHLETQPIIPITTEVEMDETMSNIAVKLKDDKDYQRLFTIVYGDENITAERILKAITQFVSTMISADSKYDKVVRNEGASFTADEQQGYTIFKNKCATCHATDLFTDQSYRNTGIPYHPIFKDEGRKRVSGKDEDFLKFRVPSLRNVEYTAPYTHDGRFQTLKALLDFYSDGVVDNPNLDPEFKKVPGKVGIPLTETEKTYLIAFLKTLSDQKFISNPAFAE